MFTRAPHHYIASAVVVLLLAVALAGCMTSGAPPISSTLEMVAQDYTFTAPAKVAGGWVTVAFENQGQEAHHAQLMRLNDGVTLDQFQATIRDNLPAALSLVTLAGGPGVVDPGGRQQATSYLQPGSYIAICVVPDAHGVPHLAHGMIAPVEVVPGGAYGTEPTADAEVQMVDFGFTLPATIAAGKQTWKVDAIGKQPHELLLVKLAAGATLADAQAWMEHPAGPPPFSNAGGLQAIDPGETGYVHLDLTPGSYIALCHVPDPGSGKAHLALGMFVPFSVE